MAAVVGDAPPEVRTALRLTGWHVAGLLAPSPFGPPEDVVGYVDAAELLDDARVDAAVVDGPGAGLLPALRAAGLLALLPDPAAADLAALQAAAGADGPPVLVGLDERWEPWARTVRAAVPLGGVPVQVTVRGWPAGAAAAAELTDLVVAWCGEVVGAVAAPAALPADRLPGGERVGWALLTSSGATVLVASDGDGPAVRISFPTARLDAAPGSVRWEGGAALPLRLPPPEVPLDLPRGVRAGLVATCSALSDARGGRDPRPYGPGDAHEPVPAQLADALAVGRVLAALRTSARTERLVPVS